MVRVTKDPQERKTELISTAERLFLKKGYEKTAVSDIVREVNVAQGTFYYYFKSKNEILEEIVAKHFTVLESEFREILDNSNEDAAMQLNEMTNAAFRILIPSKDLFNQIHLEGNEVLHDKIRRLTIESMVPLLTEVVKKGVAEGLFHVPYPSEAGEIILAVIAYQFDHPDFLTNPYRLKRMKITLENLFAKMLGTEENAFSIKM